MKNDNSNNNGESKTREDSHKVRISDGSYARESYGDSYGKEIKKALSVGSATPGPSGGGKKK